MRDYICLCGCSVKTGGSDYTILDIWADSLLLQVTLPTESLTDFLQQNMAVQPQSVAHRMGHLNIIGLITNKWIKGPTDAVSLQQIIHVLLGQVFDADSKEFSEPVGEKLRIAFWICKALVLRGDKIGMEVTGKLLELLGSSAYGATASKGFAALLGEDDFLNKENYAVVRLLTKQKIFAFCVPKIVDGFKGVSSGTV